MKIPTGNFGFETPRAVRSAPVSVSPVTISGVGAGAQGMKQIGDMGMQIGADMAAAKRREDDALARAKASNALLDHEIHVKTLASEIDARLADGSLPYADAEKTFQESYAKLERPQIDGLDPAMHETFDKGLKRLEFTGRLGVQSAAEKAKRADFKGQADVALDRLGKLAGMPGGDIDKINSQADTLDPLGRVAYGANWDKAKQDFKDRNWLNHATQRAMESKNSLEAMQKLQHDLTAADGFYAAKLDTEKRNSLMAKVDGYQTSLVQRTEAAASRAQREQERRLNKAEAEFNTFQSLADKGTLLSPEYVDRAIQMTAGTPYQDGVRAVAQQAREAGGLARQSIADQQAMLDQVDTLIAKQGRTPALDKRREQIVKVLRGSEADLKQDGLRAGLERGVIDSMAPLDIGTPEGFAASIAERLKQAETVSMWAGRPVSPLDADEADAVRTMLDALPPKQKSAAVATLASAVGPRMASAIGAQIDQQDRALALAFASASSKTTAGRYTSELLLKGATAIKDDAVMKDDEKVTGWKATIATELDGAFPDERMSTATKEAAYYIAAGIAKEKGGSVNNSDLKRAVNLASGGDIIERNGKKLPIPAGLDDDAFEDRLKAIPASDIQRQALDGKVRVGGVEMAVADFVKSIPGQELMYAGPGRYAVIVKGRPVMSSAGKPIIIGVQ